MTHNGIDIDQYILLTIYPAIIIFGLGFAGKKKKIRQSVTSLLQASTCIIFSIAYLWVVPNGGAQGLAIVLALFGVLLLFVARKYIIHPEEGQESQNTTSSSL
ncbi:MAG: hypothetical protein ACJ708_09815 [Nitrososphaeraceae archaeon]